jgi:hypothetical protein
MMTEFEIAEKALGEHEPAFPVNITDGNQTTYNYGMSLRDYLAAQAMPMFRGLDVTTYESNGQKLDFSQSAQHAYAYADAMLAARNQTKEPQ